MGHQLRIVDPGKVPEGIAVDVSETQRKGGLKAAPKINLKGTVGLVAIAKGRAILQAVTKAANAIKEWLLNPGMGFTMVETINQGVREDGPELLDVEIEIEEEGPDGPVTVSKTTREVRDSSQVKINAYLNWGDPKCMEALDAVDQQELSKDEQEARQDAVVKKLIRRAAHTARWLFKLSEVKTLDGLRDLITSFFNEGYLERADDQEVKEEERRLGGKGKNHLIRGPEGKLYKLTNDNRFGRMGDDNQSTPERICTVEELCGRVAEIFTNLRGKENQAAKKKEEQLQEGSDMDIADLWKNQQHGNGLCALQWFTKEAHPQRRVLQVRLDQNGSLWPVDASENLADLIEEAKEKKIRLPLEELKDKDGDLLFADQLPKMEPTRFLEGDDYQLFLDRRKCFYRFRELVHHCFECWITGQDRVQPQPEKPKPRPQKIERPKARPVSPETLRLIQQDLGYVGTITAMEWLVEEKPGDAILVLTDWNDRQTTFEVLAIRMRRTQTDGKTLISMVRAWHEAETFFSEVKGKEFEQTSRFEGVDEPLGKYLRACWKQTKFPAA